MALSGTLQISPVRDDPAAQALPHRRLHLGPGTVGYRAGDHALLDQDHHSRQADHLYPEQLDATAIINNYSTSETRRVEWVIGISYGDDFATAREAILELLSKDARVLQDPALRYISLPWPIIRSI